MTRNMALVLSGVLVGFVSACSSGAGSLEEQQGALRRREKSVAECCHRARGHGRHHDRCVAEGTRGRGACAPRDAGMDGGGGDAVPETPDAAAEETDDVLPADGAGGVGGNGGEVADAADVRPANGAGGSGGEGADASGGQTGGTGGTQGGLGHGNWACPASDAGIPTNPPQECSGGSLRDFSKMNPSRVPRPLAGTEVVSGPAVDMNDSGDVLIANSSSLFGGIWLSQPGCMVGLPIQVQDNPAAPQPYQLTSVFAINGRSSVAVSAMSPVGIVAMFCNGTCRVLSYTRPAYLGGVATYYTPTAINDGDLVVGTQWTHVPSAVGYYDYLHAFAWPSGSFGGTDLGLGSANAVNPSGEIVGYTNFSTGTHASSTTGTTSIDLGTLDGTSSNATAVNFAGQIVGNSLTPDGATHAFIWEAGTMRDLGTLGGSNAMALAINSSGQVAGYSNTASGEVHAFIWESGTMRDLGTLGGAMSIVGPSGDAPLTTSSPSFSVLWRASGSHLMNDAGQIAGTSLTAAGETHAFLWEAGTMRDLGTTSGTFSEAVAINVFGQVAGNSGLTQRVPFIFDPISCRTP